MLRSAFSLGRQLNKSNVDSIKIQHILSDTQQKFLGEYYYVTFALWHGLSACRLSVCL